MTVGERELLIFNNAVETDGLIGRVLAGKYYFKLNLKKIFLTNLRFF